MIVELMSTREDERKLDWKSERTGTLLRDVVLQTPSEHARLVELIENILHMKPEVMDWTDEQKYRLPDWQKWPKPFGICSDLNDQRDSPSSAPRSNTYPPLMIIQIAITCATCLEVPTRTLPSRTR
jgi:hypothetical protein